MGRVTFHDFRQGTNSGNQTTYRNLFEDSKNQKSRRGLSSSTTLLLCPDPNPFHNSSTDYSYNGSVGASKPYH